MLRRKYESSKKWICLRHYFVRRGATTMFISVGVLSQGDHFAADLSKCRCCLPACASRRDAFHEATTSWRQKDELIYYGCALLTMNSINDLRNI